MSHYALTILTSSSLSRELSERLEQQYNVLLVDRKKQYRNTIPTDDGYIVILHKEKKNVEISTTMLLDFS